MQRMKTGPGVRLIILLLILGAFLTACGSQPASAPEGATGESRPPVAPQTPPTNGQSVGQPTPGVPVQPPAGKPSLPASAILSSLDETGWQFKSLQPHLPEAEGRYQATNGEETSEVEYAYLGGTLRVIVSAAGGQVIALLFDTRTQGYAEAAAWQSSDQRLVKVQGPYVAIVRTGLLDKARFSALLGKPWSLADLVKQLGEPSYQVHLHGVGTTLYTYLPQGLNWNGSSKELRLVGDEAAEPGVDQSVVPPYTYEDYKQKAAAMWGSYARGLIGQTAHFDQILTKGKPSPDGQYRAMLDKHGGYWGNWLIIRQEGRAEQRYNTAYFVDRYEWLSNDSLVYLEQMTENQFFSIDVVQRKMGPAAALPVGQRVRQWGVVSPGHIWYEGEDGVRHDLRIP